MKIATFTRCIDSGDHAAIVGWLGGNYSETTANTQLFSSPCFCIVATVTVDFTEQEKTDLIANAAARFMLVEFS